MNSENPSSQNFDLVWESIFLSKIRQYPINEIQNKRKIFALVEYLRSKTTKKYPKEFSQSFDLISSILKQV